MGLKNVAKNVRKRGLKDALDPQVWKTYADYKEIAENGLYLEVEDILLYTEQLQYRLLRCSKCVTAGECVGYETEGCSCEVPAKMLPPVAKCSERRWPEMKQTREEWEEYKRENNIILSVFQP